MGVVIHTATSIVCFSCDTLRRDVRTRPYRDGPTKKSATIPWGVRDVPLRLWPKPHMWRLILRPLRRYITFFVCFVRTTVYVTLLISTQRVAQYLIADW